MGIAVLDLAARSKTLDLSTTFGIKDDMQTLEEKRIVHRESQRKYKLSEKGKITQEKYYFSEAKRNASYRWNSNNRIKSRIYSQVQRAIQKGIIIKQPCEICGKINAFAHHDNYAQPLNVRWLCNLCHCEFHKINKN